MKEAAAVASGKPGKTSGRSPHDLTFTGIQSGSDPKIIPILNNILTARTATLSYDEENI